MRKKAFTVMEIMVVLVITGILTTMGLSVYRNFVEESKAKVCATNLKTLQTAIEIYVIDHDSIPANLSQLPAKDIREAYKRVMNQKDAWKIELAYFIIGWRQYGIAHAAFLKDEVAKGNIGLITCPKDRTPPAAGGISYGINAALVGLSTAAYINLPKDTLVVGDCESLSFGTLEPRHERHNFLSTQTYYQVVNKNGEVSN